jgi:DNA-binding response OmpR family regulator
MSKTKDIPFSPQWKISNLKNRTSRKLQARRTSNGRIAPGRADDYLIKPFDKNELLPRMQVGLRILELYSNLAARLKALEKARRNR